MLLVTSFQPYPIVYHPAKYTSFRRMFQMYYYLFAEESAHAPCICKDEELI